MTATGSAAVDDRAAFVHAAIDRGVNPKSALLEHAAIVRGLRVTRVDNRIVLVHRPSADPLVFVNMNGPRSTVLAQRLCDDKAVTRHLLAADGLAVAESRVFGVAELDEATRYAESLGWPVVVKPTNLSRGHGITTNVRSADQVAVAWRTAVEAAGTRRDTRVLVERQFDGEDHRMIVVGGRLIAATLRRRANVVGDGSSTILELIRRKNQLRLGNPHLRGYLIPEDPALLDLLTEAGRTLADVPAEGEEVPLRGTSNVATGGDNIDVTDRVHPDFVEIAVRALAAVPGMEYGGVDIMTADISRPGPYLVGEVEFAPGPGPQFPIVGEGRDIAGAILDHYLEGAPPRRRSSTTGAPTGAAPDTPATPGRWTRSKTPAAQEGPTMADADRPRTPRDLDLAEVARRWGGAGTAAGLDRRLRVARDEADEHHFVARDRSRLAQLVSDRPDLLAAVLAEAGIPVCRAVRARPGEWDQVARFLADSAGPWSVEATDSRRALRSLPRGPERVERAYRALERHGRTAVVGEAPDLAVADLLLVDGEVVACVLRVPPSVLGRPNRAPRLARRKAAVRAHHPYLRFFPFPARLTDGRVSLIPRRRRHVRLTANPLLPAGGETVGLRYPPRGLADTARRVLHLVGSPRLAAVSFARRGIVRTTSEYFVRSAPWAVWRVDVDPTLSHFARPWAGVVAGDVHGIVLDLLRQGGAVRLPVSVTTRARDRGPRSP